MNTEKKTHVLVGSIPANGPDDVCQFGYSVASTVSQMIEDLGLYKVYMRENGDAERYVTVEGWTLLGAMLGASTRITSVVRLRDGSFEANAEVTNADGMVVSAASSICGVDEPKWSQCHEYARHSMAQTRATGKALRLAYSWIMALAGFKTTPAEEMEYSQQKLRRLTQERPFTPDDLRSKLATSIRARYRRNFTMHPERLCELQDAVAASIAGCFDDNQIDNRDNVLWYLLGVKSPSDMDAAQTDTMMKWLNPRKVNDVWIADSMSIREIMAVASTTPGPDGHQPQNDEEDEQ